jgi:NADPH-dependent F420 reductase
MQIAILGTGRMARGIGYGLRDTAHDITFGSRRATDAEALARQMGEEHGRRYHGSSLDAVGARADVFFLAVPWAAALPLVTALRDRLDGRLLVDLTNPLNETFDGVATPEGTSAAELIAAAAGPRARVVAALKNTFAATFAEPTIHGGPAADVLIAGDDEGARAETAALVRAMGFGAVDAGPLRAARAIERMTPLLIQLDRAHHWNGQSGWKLLHG